MDIFNDSFDGVYALYSGDRTTEAAFRDERAVETMRSIYGRNIYDGYNSIGVYIAKRNPYNYPANNIKSSRTKMARYCIRR